MNPFFPRSQETVLVVIDVQEKLIPAMSSKVVKKFLRYQRALITGCKTLEIPILVTEQYTRGLGRTVPELQSVLEPYTPMEKNSFSCWREEPFPGALKETGRKQVILCGIETHVCLLQTAIDLLAQGYHVHIPLDAVGSRTKENWKNGLHLARQAGAMITNTETILFQLLERAGTPEFKTIARLIK